MKNGDIVSDTKDRKCLNGVETVADDVCFRSEAR